MTRLMTEEKEALGPAFLDELDKEFKSLTGFKKTLIHRKLARTTASVEQADKSAVEESI